MAHLMPERGVVERLSAESGGDAVDVGAGGDEVVEQFDVSAEGGEVHCTEVAVLPLARLRESRVRVDAQRLHRALHLPHFVVQHTLRTTRSTKE